MGVKSWIHTSSCYGMELVQCTRISGKKSTDIKMIVDIMETLYKKPHIDIFVIVSCDGDYAHVARFIKKKKHKGSVLAFGYANTSSLLKNCCDRFININMLENQSIDNLDDEDDLDDDSDKDLDNDKDSQYIVPFVKLSTN